MTKDEFNTLPERKKIYIAEYFWVMANVARQKKNIRKCVIGFALVLISAMLPMMFFDPVLDLAMFQLFKAVTTGAVYLSVVICAVVVVGNIMVIVKCHELAKTALKNAGVAPENLKPLSKSDLCSFDKPLS